MLKAALDDGNALLFSMIYVKHSDQELPVCTYIYICILAFTTVDSFSDNS